MPENYERIGKFPKKKIIDGAEWWHKGDLHFTLAKELDKELQTSSIQKKKEIFIRQAIEEKAQERNLPVEAVIDEYLKKMRGKTAYVHPDIVSRVKELVVEHLHNIQTRTRHI